MKIETAMPPARNAKRPRPSRRLCALLALIMPRMKAIGVMVYFSQMDVLAERRARPLAPAEVRREQAVLHADELDQAQERRSDATASSPAPTPTVKSDACGGCTSSQPA